MPRLFLPPNLCTRCEVVEESPTHIVREATIAGDDLREIIAFEPGSRAAEIGLAEARPQRVAFLTRAHLLSDSGHTVSSGGIERTISR